LKLQFALSVALALEFMLANEIIKTVTIRNMYELYILGAIIVLRVIMTFVIQWQSQPNNQSQTKSQQGGSQA